MFDIVGLDDVIDSISALEKALKPKRMKSMNKDRARFFYKWSIGKVRRRGLGMKRLTPATQKIQGKNHAPMWGDNGDLFKAMKVKDEGDFYSCGFFQNDSTKPEDGELTWFQIALIHTTGYRIPVDPSSIKGKKVRAFLASHGIYLRATTKYLFVEPRPVIEKAFNRYKNLEHDLDIAEQHFDKLLDKVW